MSSAPGSSWGTRRAGAAPTLLLSPHARSTAAALLRWLAVWLAIIVGVQGLAASFALGSGPLHRHRETPASPHRHHHAEAERHHHGAADETATVALSVESSADLDAGAFALTAALALMVLAVARAPAGRRPRAVWRAAPGWAWLSHCPESPARPPRAA